MIRICKRCGCEVKVETDDCLKKEYPYYCPSCDENMYSFETEEISGTIEEHKLRVMHYLIEIEDYLPLSGWFVKSTNRTIEAINKLLSNGILRMVSCEEPAIELNKVK